jgi:hypothetical protein
MVLDDQGGDKAPSRARIALYLARRAGLSHHGRAGFSISRANSVRVRLQSRGSASVVLVDARISLHVRCGTKAALSKHSS